MNESRYNFLLRQQDNTKKLIHETLTCKDSFSNYIRYFLDNIDTETVDKFDFFANKNLKYLLYMFNNYLVLSGQPTVPVRHSKLAENEVIMKEVQNRRLYLVESVIKLVENDKSHLTPLSKNENKIK